VPRLLQLQIKLDAPHVYEGIVLETGVRKLCDRMQITQREFGRRARTSKSVLYRAYNGGVPLRVYAYLWLFIAAVYGHDAYVDLYDPRCENA
jgi:hypothetical protein